MNKHEAKCSMRIMYALAAVLFTTLIENLRLRSSAEVVIVLNLFLNFEQK